MLKNTDACRNEKEKNLDCFPLWYQVASSIIIKSMFLFNTFLELNRKFGRRNGKCPFETYVQ